MKVVLSVATKGGTGKSIVAINLAKALSKKGKTALVDTDFESSNIGILLNLSENSKIDYEAKVIKPVIWNNINVFSLSLITYRDQATYLIGTDIQYLLKDYLESLENLGNMDYIVIDTPGGAGDVLKMIANNFKDKMAGAVIVLHPVTAEVDLSRTVKVMEYAEIPILGVIQNFAYLDGNRMYGSRDLSEYVKQKGIENYYELPLDPMMPQKIMESNPLFNDMSVFEAIAEQVERAKTGTSIMSRIKKSVKEGLIESLLPILVELVRYVNSEVDIEAIKQQYGFVEHAVFKVVLMDYDFKEELGEVYLRAKDKLYFLKEPPEVVHYELIVTPQSLAWVILGYKKNDKGVRVPISITDAVFMGKVKVRGYGSLIKIIQLYQSVFANAEIMERIRSKYSSLLDVFA